MRAVLRDPGTGRWRRKRIVLIGAALFVVVGSLSAYAGYHVLFRKNPDAVREIEASEQRQQELDRIFDTPAQP